MHWTDIRRVDQGGPLRQREPVRSTRELAQSESAERPRFERRTRCLRKPSNADSRIVTLRSPPTTVRSSSTVAKLIEALKRSIPEGTQNAERKKEALRLGSELLRGTKYEQT
jgi:hypothetical protein